MSWVSYKNGNYTVSLNLNDGTKIRYNRENFFDPDTVESMDVKITNCCDIGCAMCHENSVPNGAHGDVLSECFIDRLHPYTELAIGGGNPLCHPDLMAFLKKCKSLKLICNMTVNQTHFEQHFEFLHELVDAKLIFGLGVSLNNPTDAFIEKINTFPNAVVHVIAGLVSLSQLDFLSTRVRKILILGYKQVRRGEQLYLCRENYIDDRIKQLKDVMPSIINDKRFEVVSFDNLALNQLCIKEILPEDIWKAFYMGDDGQDGQQTSASMFVDLVERKFAKNSCASDEERFDLLDTAEEMFGVLKNGK